MRQVLDINPTAFNVVFDVVAVLNGWALGHVLEWVQPLVLGWVVRRGVGVPLSFFSGGTWKIRDMVRMPSRTRLVWLPLIASTTVAWSHTAADADLQFVQQVDSTASQALYLDLNSRDDFVPSPRLLGETFDESTESAPTFQAEENEYKVESAVDGITTFSSPLAKYGEIKDEVVPFDNWNVTVLTSANGYLVSVDKKLGTLCKNPEGVETLLGSDRVDFCELATAPENIVDASLEVGVTKSTSTYVFPGQSCSSCEQIPVRLVVGGQVFDGFENFAVPLDWRDKSKSGNLRKFGRDVTTLDAIIFGEKQLTVSAARLSYAGLGFLMDASLPVPHEYIITAQVAEDDGEFLCQSSGCLMHVFMECDLFPEEFSYGKETETPLCYTFGGDIVTGDFGLLPPGYLTVVSGAMGRNRRRSAQPGTFVRIGMGSVVAALLSGATIQEDWIEDTKVRPSIGGIFILFSVLPWVTVAILGLFFFKKDAVFIPTTVWELLVLGKSDERVLSRSEEHSQNPYPPQPTNLLFGLQRNESGQERLGLVDTSTTSIGSNSSVESDD